MRLVDGSWCWVVVGVGIGGLSGVRVFRWNGFGNLGCFFWNVGPGLGLALVGCWVYDVGSGLGLRYLGAKCLALGRVWHWRLLGCCAGVVVRCVWLIGVGIGPGLCLALVGCSV